MAASSSSATATATPTPKMSDDPRFSGENWHKYERLKRKCEELQKALKLIGSFPITPSPPTPPELPYPAHLQEFTPPNPPDSPSNKLVRDFRSFNQSMLEIGLRLQTLRSEADKFKNVPGHTFRNIHARITQTKHGRNRMHKTMDKVKDKIINADHLSVSSFYEFDLAQDMTDFKTKIRVIDCTPDDHVKEIRLRQEDERFVFFEGTDRDGEEGRNKYDNYDPSFAPRSKGWWVAYQDSKTEDAELQLERLERELKKVKMEIKEARERLVHLRKTRKRARAEEEEEDGSGEEEVEKED